MKRIMMARLALGWVLSSIWIGLAWAHEINPTIADLTVNDGQVQVNLQMNAEAFLAGLDLDSVTNTDDVSQGTDYGVLRSLPPGDLAVRVRENAPTVADLARITSDTGDMELSLGEIVVPDVGDVELPRTSGVTLVGPLPDGATALRVVWASGGGTLILRQQGVDAPYTGVLSGGGSSDWIALVGGQDESGLQAFLRYVPVGFDHILPKGLDHILFVLGLFFFSLRLRPLIWQISAFTLAHTVTLALGALGWVTVPAAIVEPLIAASIVWIAVENILRPRMSALRPVVVFGFGLLHGLGFASVLAEFGLPTAQFIPALLGFNVGVELGQLTVIFAAHLLVGVWFGKQPWYRTRIANPASIVIAAIGAYWFVERVFL